MIKLFRYLLFPVSVVYGTIVIIRNFLYDNNLFFFKPQSFDIPVIAVGNITVGGTGKTPHIEYLIRLLNPTQKVGVISRGYKRKTKGFVLAYTESSATTIGDEPYQYYCKFTPKIHVAVGEKRAIAIPRLLSIKPETQVILLDDAFQHRGVKPQLNIVLIDFNRLIFKDLLLPMGHLREPITGINRADIIIFTKCPQDIGYKKEYIKIKLSTYIQKKWKPIYFTTYQYGNPVQFYGPNIEPTEIKNIVVVAGLAQNEPFADYLKNNFTILEKLFFADHHCYTSVDVEKILKISDTFALKNICILTTEKDMVKLKASTFEPILKNVPCFYVPIEVKFLENELQFQKMIFKTLDIF